MEQIPEVNIPQKNIFFGPIFFIWNRVEWSTILMTDEKREFVRSLFRKRPQNIFYRLHVRWTLYIAYRQEMFNKRRNYSTRKERIRNNTVDCIILYLQFVFLEYRKSLLPLAPVWEILEWVERGVSCSPPPLSKFWLNVHIGRIQRGRWYLIRSQKRARILV
jgi:hypothetical protein